METLLKWFGGKHYLAPKIHECAPPKDTYKTRCLPYGGAFNESWEWDCEGVNEIYNDRDGRLSNLFRVLRDKPSFDSFRRMAESTPFSRREWQQAYEVCERMADRLDPSGVVVAPDPVWAYWFFVLCRQSHGGNMKTFSAITVTRTRRGVNAEASAWWSVVAGLDEVHNRLGRVLVEWMDALPFMRGYDSESVFFYCDPPYLPETRSAKDVYGFEMTTEEHKSMLLVLRELKSRVLLSGYPNDLYNRMLPGWRTASFEVMDCASKAETKKKKTEVFWMNYDQEGRRL